MNRRFAVLLVAGIALALAVAAGLYGYARLMQYEPADAVVIDFAGTPREAMSEVGLLLGKGDFLLQTCCAHSIAYPLVGGRRVAAFGLQAGDHPVKGNFRSEARLRSNRVGREAAYDFELSTPRDWPASAQRVIVAQWHGTDDRFLLEPGRFPPLELAIEGDSWRLYKAWDARLRSHDEGHGNTQGRKLIGSAPFTPGLPVSWRVEVRWSPTDDGYVRAYRNGQLFADDHGPNAFRDLVGPYMKFGVYVPDWKRRIDPRAGSRQILYRRVSMVQR